MPPTFGNGKICYIEIPAFDISLSVIFYGKVFGWNIRERGDKTISFDDAVGEVSGVWVTGRPPASEPGLLIYIMVDDVAATMEKITAAGGEIAQPIGADAPEITARFRDPTGNVFGLSAARIMTSPHGSSIPASNLKRRRLSSARLSLRQSRCLLLPAALQTAESSSNPGPQVPRQRAPTPE